MNYECNQTGCHGKHPTNDEICETNFIKSESPFKINFVDFGMGYLHNMPCAVYHGDEDGSHAVLNTNKGVFEPSWKAQREGWQLVQAKTKFQKYLLRKFFDRFS